MLELRQLDKRFGDLQALQGVDLAVAPGRMHGFVGRNGSGKTTTMRIAVGLSEPDAGTVRWAGGPVTPEIRRRIGYMPEERGLYPKMSAVDQLRFFGQLSGQSAADAGRAAGDILARLGLGERAAEPVERLSLGNQQRVQLGAALVARPDLLVLDEPFSGLDPVGVDVLAGVLAGEAERGVAILFSSHQLELVERLCDEVTIIEAGRVVASGPIAQLRASRSADVLRVEVTGARPGWAAAIPGVRIVDVHGDVVTLELAPGTDDQRVLDAARAAGRVRSFRWVTPTLTELFREVVAA